MRAPNPVSGNTAEASWLNKLLRFAISLTPLGGANCKIRRTPNGWFLDVDAQGGSGGTETKLQAYRFKSNSDDYIVCKTWDGTTEGTDEVPIAKPFRMRYSATSILIDGVTINYGGYSTINQSRTATVVGTSQGVPEVYTPRYLVNDIIWAMKADWTGVTVGDNQLTLMDANLDGRQFATIFV